MSCRNCWQSKRDGRRGCGYRSAPLYAASENLSHNGKKHIGFPLPPPYRTLIEVPVFPLMHKSSLSHYPHTLPSLISRAPTVATLWQLEVNISVCILATLVRQPKKLKQKVLSLSLSLYLHLYILKICILHIPFAMQNNPQHIYFATPSPSQKKNIQHCSNNIAWKLHFHFHLQCTWCQRPMTDKMHETKALSRKLNKFPHKCCTK